MAEPLTPTKVLVLNNRITEDGLSAKEVVGFIKTLTDVRAPGLA